MNAKETLQKIAEALNIAATPEATPEVTPEVKTEETPEAVIETPEAVEETVVETPKEEPSAEVVETPKEEIKEEPKEDPKVAALEAKVSELKEILANALREPEVTPPTPEAVEPEGLKHNPEVKPNKAANGIGKKGGSIQERVFKYINNN